MKINNLTPLIIFEMANNHMGSLEHAQKMIFEFAKVKENYDFNFAFKFQFRDIDTFIHPDYKTRMDIKYVKRFTETKLSIKDYEILLDELKKHNFISVCTPFDEKSVDLIEKMDFDIIKIGSPSFPDWPLFEKIIKTDKPIIASTAGAKIDDIDNVVSFFQHREKDFAIMHCIGEYPTVAHHLQLNQIDLFKERYPELTVGFSTHENPDNTDAIKMAIAKGAKIFEKHVAVETDEYPKNDYSAEPDQVSQWLDAAELAFDICGISGERYEFSEKELSDLRRFRRGVFAGEKISKGHSLKSSELFYAFPNQNGQLLATDMSKYAKYVLKKVVDVNEPILEENVEATNRREQIYSIVQDVKSMLERANAIVPGKAELEISHHYGLEQFYDFGITMITIVNREYCKKLIVLLPGQKHPEQYHKQKGETFVVVYGQIQLVLNGEKSKCQEGDVITVDPGVKHAFSSENGAIIEEISSTHYLDDSYYTDDLINQNKERKTYLSYWID